MEWYEAEVRDLERRVAASEETCPIVFYGSSSIRMWTTLAEDIGTPHVLNLGFGGSTLEACAYFFERLVVPAQPCSIVVYAGDNDLGDGRSPEQVMDSFRALARKMKIYLPGISFGFISIKPSPARASISARIQKANESIANEISTLENAYFIDIYKSMLGADGRPRADLYQSDGLHMSPGGYRLWTEAVSKYRSRIFTEEFSKTHHGE